MIFDANLTFIQSLQMVALAPCILVIFYLFIASRNKQMAIIPIMYFMSLSAGLLNLMLPAFLDFSNYKALETALVMGETFIPAISFLLIFQFILNKIPSAWYWLILLVPAIATGPFILGFVGNDLSCVTMDICVPSYAALNLNNVVISSLIFMLLIVIMVRRRADIIGSPELRKYKYWLIMSLVVYNVGLLALDLGLVAEMIAATKYALIKTIIKLAFIYMVMTSIFRVFTDLFDIKPVILRRTGLTKYEQELASKIRHMLENEKVYREAGFNRAKLSDTLGVGEHLLSKIINVEFKKSFSDLANEYRVNEEKGLLENSEAPVTTISFDVGFNSIASFNRVFKQVTGKPPTLYREEVSNSNKPDESQKHEEMNRVMV